MVETTLKYIEPAILDLIIQFNLYIRTLYETHL